MLSLSNIFFVFFNFNSFYQSINLNYYDLKYLKAYQKSKIHNVGRLFILRGLVNVLIA
jgi:hypothetical protein